MKKLCTAAVLLLSLLVFSSCTLGLAPSAETLKGWSFQFNESTNDYSVFFAFLDKSGKYIADSADVDVRIVDDNGNELFSDTRSISKDDFGYYSSKAAGEEYLANVRIQASELSEGTSSSGTVYITIHKGNVIWFEEVSCRALYCLPIKNVTVVLEPSPTELELKGIDGITESTIRIDDITSVYDGRALPSLRITLIGIKTYANDNAAYKSPYDVITYKLYDSGGYLVDSGSVYLRQLAEGDRFKDDTIVFYNAQPGETYTLKLESHSWDY